MDKVREIVLLSEDIKAPVQERDNKGLSTVNIPPSPSSPRRANRYSTVATAKYTPLHEYASTVSPSEREEGEDTVSPVKIVDSDQGSINQHRLSMRDIAVPPRQPLERPTPLLSDKSRPSPLRLQSLDSVPSHLQSVSSNPDYFYRCMEDIYIRRSKIRNSLLKKSTSKLLSTRLHRESTGEDRRGDPILGLDDPSSHSKDIKENKVCPPPRPLFNIHRVQRINRERVFKDMARESTRGSVHSLLLTAQGCPSLPLRSVGRQSPLPSHPSRVPIIPSALGGGITPGRIRLPPPVHTKDERTGVRRGKHGPSLSTPVLPYVLTQKYHL